MSVDNILAVYRQATPDEKRDGVVWYAEALASCMNISNDTSVPLHIVVGVCAALSPNNKWDRNVQNARDLIVAFINGDYIDSVKVSTYHAMKRKAWGILEAMPDHDGVIALLNGQKIVSFYRNIVGDDTCTIDGHARNIYYGERVGLTNDKSNVGKRDMPKSSRPMSRLVKKCGSMGVLSKPLKCKLLHGLHGGAYIISNRKCNKNATVYRIMADAVRRGLWHYCNSNDYSQCQ